jgi:hypothetical protein
MYSFVKIEDSSFPALKYDWCLEVSSLKTLFDYEESFTKNKLIKTFQDCLKSKEYAHLTGTFDWTQEHTSSDLSKMIIRIFSLKGVSLLETLSDFYFSVLKGKMNVLLKAKKIYIQKSGGYFPYKDSLIVKDIKEVEKICFPGNGIPRYLKWPKGSHWYVKIDDLDVEVDGKCKWDLKSEAEEAAKKFLESNKEKYEKVPS